MGYEPRKLMEPCKDCKFIICQCDALELMSHDDTFEFDSVNTEPIAEVEEETTTDMDLNRDYEYFEMQEVFNMWRD